MTLYMQNSLSSRACGDPLAPFDFRSVKNCWYFIQLSLLRFQALQRQLRACLYFSYIYFRSSSSLYLLSFIYLIFYKAFSMKFWSNPFSFFSSQLLYFWPSIMFSSFSYPSVFQSFPLMVLTIAISIAVRSSGRPMLANIEPYFYYSCVSLLRGMSTSQTYYFYESQFLKVFSMMSQASSYSSSLKDLESENFSFLSYRSRALRSCYSVLSELFLFSLLSLMAKGTSYSLTFSEKFFLTRFSSWSRYPSIPNSKVRSLLTFMLTLISSIIFSNLVMSSYGVSLLRQVLKSTQSDNLTIFQVRLEMVWNSLVFDLTPQQIYDRARIYNFCSQSFIFRFQFSVSISMYFYFSMYSISSIYCFSC